MTAKDYRYWAFLSYSSKDSAIATRLHKRLETYSIPKDLVGRPGRDDLVPKRLFPIFRDRDELPLSSDLGTTIQDALKASRYLIVLCSPDSAKSHWVNEEVRYFKSLGHSDRILAVILDGEPNASDLAENAADECFPPALRVSVDAFGALTEERTEPIGGDLRKGGDGWTPTLLKAVAGITGLGFDAFARREQKRNRRRRMLGSTAGLFLLAGLTWTWDYNRLKVGFYANVGSSFGIPVGIAYLSPQQRSHRRLHYRIESRRGQVRKVQSLNGRSILWEDEDKGGIAESRFYYRENGELARIEHYDKHGRHLVRDVYNPFEPGPSRRQFIDRKDDAGSAPLAFNSSQSNQAKYESMMTSQATASMHTYDKLGRVIHVSYHNHFRAQRPQKDGFFGKRFEYEGESWLPKKIEYLAADNHPGANRLGVGYLLVSYSNLGDRTSESFFDSAGAPVFTADNGAIVRLSRDEIGNLVDRKIFSGENKPATNKNGVHHTAFTVDSQGFPTSYRHFDSTGLHAQEHENKIHRVDKKYDSRGNVLERRAFDVSDVPCLDPDGLHLVVFSYNNRGLLTERRFFGIDAEPTTILGEDVHHQVFKYREDGLRVSIEKFGIDGQPTIGKGFWHRAEEKRDTAGRLTAHSFFGVDGDPCFNNTGVHRLEYKYDERGQLSSETNYGPKGEPVLKNGVHRTVVTINETASVRESRFFGVNGEKCIRTDVRAHRITINQDALGNPVDKWFFDIHDQPTVGPQGGFHLKWTYDKNGRLIEQSIFDVNELPTVIRPSGIHLDRFAYDVRGNLIQNKFFSPSGSPVPNMYGIYRVESEYNNRNLKTRERYFGLNGKAVLSRATGEYGFEVKFGEHGKEIIRKSLSENGDHAPNYFGVATAETDYDSFGSKMREAYFDVDHNPVVHRRKGYHELDIICDSRGNVLQTRRLGKNGEPVADANGLHQENAEFDRRNNAIKITTYDEFLQPIQFRPDLPPQIRIVRDVRGIEIERSHYDGNGVPIEIDGLHQLIIIPTPRGNPGEILRYGINGNPATEYGVHRTFRSFDELGNQIEEAYFGADLEPVNDERLGCHRIKMGYTPKGEHLSSIYLDLEGRRTLNTSGRAEKRMRYDNSGRKIEELSFGVNLQLLANAEGIAISRFRYDDFGQLIEESYFDEKNDPASNSAGFIRITFEFNPIGQSTGKTGWRPDGNSEPLGR